jgi:tetratricopeptide (TPR) repeat protein
MIYHSSWKRFTTGRIEFISVNLRVSVLALLLSVLFVLGWAEPAVAQQSPSPNLSIEQLQNLENLANQAFTLTEKGDFPQAETYWTQIIEEFPANAAAWSNRGNSRVSQNKLNEAIADYNTAMELAPDATDPFLNRGAALEGLGKWEEAIADYNHILEIDPNDAMAYNNRGNAEAGLGQWEKAIADYKKSADTAPNFAFARANYALALYQMGQKDKALREMRNIIRKYPQFADVRAALTAALWEQGNKGEAESNWVAAVGLDNRYKDINWVANIRRWPPTMVAALEKFQQLK